MQLEYDNTLRVLVCQRGARRRYAVPRLLEESGSLTALYTDSSGYSVAGRIAKVPAALGLATARWRALASRIPRGIPREKVFSSDRSLCSFLPGCSRDLSAIYRKWGLRDANVVYSMYGEDIDFLEWAKAQGARIVADIFVHPGTNRIMADECARFLPNEGSDAGVIDAEDRHSMRIFKLADTLVCPSEWVAEGVKEFAPEFDGKVAILPYGSSLKVNAGINESPEVGRILFAGRDPLRKGLHYLAEAAHLVRQSGLCIEVRVAGVEDDSIAWMEHRRELRCLGRLPMDQMRQEYERADLFVLPSLSEGQAGVVLEAMACGCPVIATRASGVDFEPGCGITVPARNAQALAREIIGVVADRKRRNELACGALRQAAVFSMEAWKDRLIRNLKDIVAGERGP